MVQVIKGKPTFAEMFGTGLSSGLSSGFEQLAKNKLKQYAANQERQRNVKGLMGIPGISPEQAEQLSNLDPQILSPVMKELISQPRRAAFGNAISALSNNLFQNGGQPGMEGQGDQQSIDLSQLNPNEALQLINTQLNAQNRRDQQEERTRQFNEKQEQHKREQEEKNKRNKEEYDLKYAKDVEPYLTEISKELKQDKDLKDKAEKALKLLRANKKDWPGAFIGNLPDFTQPYLIRNPAIRKYMADVSDIVVQKANTRKGQPSNYKTKLELLGKAGIDKPVETQEALLQDIIDDYYKEKELNQFAHSKKDKETGRYPLNLRSEGAKFELARDNPLEYPEFYEEGTNYTDDNGTEHEVVNGKWEDKE